MLWTAARKISTVRCASRGSNGRTRKVCIYLGPENKDKTSVVNVNRTDGRSGDVHFEAVDIEKLAVSLRESGAVDAGAGSLKLRQIMKPRTLLHCSDRDGEAAAPAKMPPSMMNSAPVTYADSSDARKTTMEATSSGVPKRPSGISFVISLLRS